MADYEVELGGTVYLQLATYDSSGEAANADALPTYAIWDYDLSGALASGTGTLATVDATIDGWYYGSHDCTAATGFASGKEYPVRMPYTENTTARVDYQTILIY